MIPKGDFVMTPEKKKRIINYTVFMLLLLMYLELTFFLFYKQSMTMHHQDDVLYYAIKPPGQGWQLAIYPKYDSDIDYYVKELQGQHENFLPYPLLYLTGRLFLPFAAPETAVAAAVTFLNGLAVLGLKYYLDRFLDVRENGIKRGLIFSLLVFSLFFVSMLCAPYCVGRLMAGRQLGTFTPNPYHNATYLAARPFAIPAFFLFGDILTFYEREDKWYHPKYLLFAVSLFVTTLAKPSFTLVMAATAGILMLWRLLKGHKVKAFFQLGVWFIPTFLLLLYQYTGFFGEGKISEAGIGFGFLTAWSTVSENIVQSVLLVLIFPLTVAVFCLLQKEKLELLKFSWQFYLIGLGTFVFLYEKDEERLYHLNFAWGYMYALFFLFVVSLTVLVKNTLGKKQPFWQLGVQWGMYGLHLICGLDYFCNLLMGGTYC